MIMYFFKIQVRHDSAQFGCCCEGESLFKRNECPGKETE